MTTQTRITAATITDQQIHALRREAQNAATICDQVVELWRHPDAWTQHTAAVDARGCPVMTDNPAARSFCALGAVLKVTGYARRKGDALPGERGPDARHLAMDTVRNLENARTRKDYRSVHDVNDYEWTNATEARDAFRRAADQLRRIGQ